MAPSFCILIPARFASTRFPGKPLAEIGGKTMIRRVFEAACEAANSENVWVATDDARIYDHVQTFGQAVMTSPDHPSGTDRCFEAGEKTGKKFDIIVNLQGDEPFIKPEQVQELLNLFRHEQVQIATLKKAIYDAQDIDNPNVVKVVTDLHNKALYFSRSRIPFMREADAEMQYYRHIGLYAYRSSVLKEITALSPTRLEHTEKLEQLRWLENGYHIAVAETHWHSPAVDTPEDLELAIRFLENQG